MTDAPESMQEMSPFPVGAAETNASALRSSLLRRALSEGRYWLPLAVLVFFVASVLMSGWPGGLKPNIEYPFTYIGDGLSHSNLIQRLIEAPWYMHNERSGYPFGSDIRDYPDADSGSFVVLKLLGWIFGSYYAALNIYFLLGFPVTFAASYMVLRSMNVSRYFAAGASVAFVFLPFHFQRLGHLFYTWYFVIPFYVYYSYRFFVLKDFPPGVKSKWKYIGKHAVIFLLLACFGVYYAAFGVIVLAIGAVAGAIRNKSKKHLLVGLGACMVVASGVLANTLPHLYFEATHGTNSLAVKRAAGESEIYGLKVAQMLLPRAGHRIDALASETHLYSTTFPLINENETSTLGFIGSAGFLLLLALSFMSLAGRRSDERLMFLAMVAVVLTLTAVVGGFASLFSLFVSPLIRAWNRASIFIGFSSLAAAFIFIQLVCQTWSARAKPAWSAVLVAGGVSLFALWDQTTSPCIACNDALRAKFMNDREFVKRIEAVLPAGSAVYQLPYMGFPEVPRLYHLDDYALLIGFLHSSSLRWNYGGVKGRVGDLFYRGLAQQDIKRQLEVIGRIGFAGIYVDRRGFEDNGQAIEGELRENLGAGPEFSSADGQLAFYRTKIIAPEVPEGTGPDEIMQRAGFFVDRYGPNSGLRR